MSIRNYSSSSSSSNSRLSRLFIYCVILCYLFIRLLANIIGFLFINLHRIFAFRLLHCNY